MTENNSTATGQETKAPEQAKPVEVKQTTQAQPAPAKAESSKPAELNENEFAGVSASFTQPQIDNPYAQKMEPLNIPKASGQQPLNEAPSKPGDNAEAKAPTAGNSQPPSPTTPAAPEDEKPEDLDMIQRYLRMNGIGAGNTVGDLVNDVRVDNDGCTHFKLLNGTELFMGIGQLAGQAPDDFVGVYRGTFDETTAKAVIMAAMDKGWTSINLHGNEKKKDMLYIQAMKAGVEVNPASYKPDPKKLQKWLDQGLLTEEDLLPKKDPDPAGATENKAEKPEAPKAEAEAPAPKEPETPQMQMSRQWQESGEEFQKNFNVDLPIPPAPKGEPITSPTAEQQANFMSRIEKDMVKVQKDIDTRQANTKSAAHPNGRIQENWVEKKQHMQRTLNNIDKRLKNNETMPAAQFTKINEHYKAGNYKMAADVSGLKVTMKDQGMKVQTPTAKAPETSGQTKPAAKKAQSISL